MIYFVNIKIDLQLVNIWYWFDPKYNVHTYQKVHMREVNQLTWPMAVFTFCWGAGHDWMILTTCMHASFRLISQWICKMFARNCRVSLKKYYAHIIGGKHLKESNKQTCGTIWNQPSCRFVFFLWDDYTIHIISCVFRIFFPVYGFRRRIMPMPW